MSRLILGSLVGKADGIIFDLLLGNLVDSAIPIIVGCVVGMEEVTITSGDIVGTLLCNTVVGKILVVVVVGI